MWGKLPACRKDEQASKLAACSTRLASYITGDNWLVVSPEGHYAGSREIDEHIVYVAQTEAGHHITLSPAEFQKRYGWKNDAAKARLLKLP